MTDPHDDLDDLLSPTPGVEPAGLREAVLRHTERHLAWRRTNRRVAKLLAVAVVFGGGLFVGVAVRNEPRGVPEPALPVVRHSTEVVTVVVAVPVPTPAEPSGPVAASPEPPTAAAAELRAELADDPAEAARLYRLAGDKYLNDRADYANATRCYRLYLRRAGDPGLALDPTDTWLLTSLKTTALTEKVHASKTGG